MIADAADSISAENIVAYVCLAGVAIAAICGYVLLILFDKIEPPSWLGKRPRGGEPDRRESTRPTNDPDRHP